MRILLTYILRLIDVIIFARRYTTRSHRAILFYPHTRRAFYTFEKLERYEHSPARVELQRPDPRVVDLVHAREHQVAFELYRILLPTYTVPTCTITSLVSHAYLVSPYVMSLLYTYPACMAQCSTEYFSFFL